MDEALQRDTDDRALLASVAAIVVWMRFSAARHLTWNRNYNIKPREISAAQVEIPSPPAASCLYRSIAGVPRLLNLCEGVLSMQAFVFT